VPVLLSLDKKLAGMDGNLTRPGRLRSAPQTLLETAGPASMTVHQRPLEIGRLVAQSVNAHPRPQFESLITFLRAHRSTCE
jgi:hypothetical protein